MSTYYVRIMYKDLDRPSLI